MCLSRLHGEKNDCACNGFRLNSVKKETVRGGKSAPEWSSANFGERKIKSPEAARDGNKDLLEQKNFKTEKHPGMGKQARRCHFMFKIDEA